MSVPVRIKDDVVARVQVVADGERRSLANMVEVLLLRALDGSPVEVRKATGEVVAVLTEREVRSTQETPTAGSRPVAPSRSVSAVTGRPHMRKDRPALECPSRELPCPTCGAR